MKIKVKFFAILRERAGTGEVSKDVHDGTTVGELWALLKREYAPLGSVEMRLLYAVNQNYVGADYILKDRDEVVFVPPVSGG